MVSAANKIVMRKKEYRTLHACKELTNADPSKIYEVDFTFNMLE